MFKANGTTSWYFILLVIVETILVFSYNLPAYNPHDFTAHNDFETIIIFCYGGNNNDEAPFANRTKQQNISTTVQNRTERGTKEEEQK